MSRLAVNLAALSSLGLLLLSAPSCAQISTQPPAQPVDPHHLQPFTTTPTLSPGVLELIRLEGDFEKDVEKGGGKAFASWFADDAVTLNNGKPAVRGQRAIAAQANWNSKDYQLTWYAEGAQMGPSGDTGFTWGHYEAHAHDAKGQPITTDGRYITFWKKVHGAWKVALDASANDVPATPNCCNTPQP
jgi:ketosteroid isomerase-like protein